MEKLKLIGIYTFLLFLGLAFYFAYTKHQSGAPNTKSGIPTIMFIAYLYNVIVLFKKPKAKPENSKTKSQFQKDYEKGKAKNSLTEYKNITLDDTDSWLKADEEFLRNRDHALWTKCLYQSKHDQNEARYLYVNIRVKEFETKKSPTDNE